MKPFSNSKERNSVPTEITTEPNWHMWAIGLFLFGLALTVPLSALASVESSLVAVQAKLVGTILPLAAICGLVVAGFSFVAGRPNARSHLTLAIMGAVIGFGAESIVSLIRSLIQ